MRLDYDIDDNEELFTANDLKEFYIKGYKSALKMLAVNLPEMLKNIENGIDLSFEDTSKHLS